MVNRKHLFHKDDHFFLWPYLHQACIVSNVIEKLVGIALLNILRITRAILMNFFLLNTQILILKCKVLYSFQKIFTSEKVKGNIKKEKIIIFLKFWLVMYKKWFIPTKEHHHLEFILDVAQNVWHNQGLLVYISVYNSACFWFISWTINYTIKTRWASTKDFFQNIWKKRKERNCA